MVEGKDVTGVLSDDLSVKSFALSGGGAYRVLRIEVPCSDDLASDIRCLADEVVIVSVSYESRMSDSNSSITTENRTLTRTHKCGHNSSDLLQGL